MHIIEYLRKNSVICFVILAFTLHWFLLALSIVSVIPYEIVVFLSSWTPNIAAFIVLGLILKQNGGIRKLIEGWCKWKVGIVWYLVALSPIAIGFLAIGLLFLLKGRTAPATQPVTVVNLLVILISTLITGATGEELGWRGFLLPRVQNRHNAWIASLIVGSVVILWHIPLWFMPRQLWAELPFWAFAILCIASSVIFTWMMNSTGGNLVMATLMHAAQNFAMNISGLMGLEPAQYSTVSALLYGGCAVLVMVFAGPSGLNSKSKKKLST